MLRVERSTGILTNLLFLNISINFGAPKCLPDTSNIFFRHFFGFSLVGPRSAL